MSQTKLKTHWVADLDHIDDEVVERIAEDIKAKGQKVPILALKDGTILDGRTRMLACKKVGVEPVIQVIDGDGKDEWALWEEAISTNDLRRERTPSQRACKAAAVIARWYAEKFGDTNPKHLRGTDAQQYKKRYVKFTKVYGANQKFTERALKLYREARALYDEVVAGRNLVDAYEEHMGVVKQKDERSKQTAQIREYAPDLAAQHEEGKLSFEDAVAAYAERQAEEEKRAGEHRTRVELSCKYLGDTLRIFVDGFDSERGLMEFAELVIEGANEANPTFPITHKRAVQAASALNVIAKKLKGKL